jgi:hypothetical protein
LQEEFLITDEKVLNVLDPILLMLEKNLSNEVNYVNEYAICDALIRPILGIAIEDYPFNIWSHVPYHVDNGCLFFAGRKYLLWNRHNRRYLTIWKTG